jgi:hypothetical protein
MALIVPLISPRFAQNTAVSMGHRTLKIVAIKATARVIDRAFDILSREAREVAGPPTNVHDDLFDGTQVLIYSR